MTDDAELFAKRPALPLPQRPRWQPLRLGLVDLFHYDSEEFWFHSGRLLLRGNNGTGKSKVLSLTLPLLLDANLRSARVEPDGDAGKKMAWNLLMGSYQRRIGYSWIEFGRIAEDGEPRYLTLGVGLSAVAARTQVESWFFMLENGTRIGQDLWLTSDKQVALTRDKLREAIEGRGHLFPTAESYRRAVDERLFQLGAQRYDALMDTLIQLRQPQLSRKPDEAGLSRALSEALPPLPQELLADVAEALNQLEEDRRQLEEFRQLAEAVQRFDQRYRQYTGILSRRQARALRQVQTDFEKASQERRRAQQDLTLQQAEELEKKDLHGQAQILLRGQRTRYDTLLLDPANQSAKQLEFVQKEAESRRAAALAQQASRDQAAQRLERESKAGAAASQRAAQARDALLNGRGLCAAEAAGAGIATGYEANPLARLPPEALAEMTPRDFSQAPQALHEAIKRRREQIGLLQRRHEALALAWRTLAQEQATQRDRLAEFEDAVERRAEADAAAEQGADQLLEDWSSHFARLEQLQPQEPAEALEALAAWVRQPEGENPALQSLRQAQQQASERHAGRQVQLDTQAAAWAEEHAALLAEQQALNEGRDAEPPLPHTREPRSREGRAGAPLWQLLDFQPHLDAAQRAGLEAALEASGLLDAWVTPDGQLLAAANGRPWLDSQWVRRPPARGTQGAQDLTLAAWLRVDIPSDSSVGAKAVEMLLASVSCSPEDSGEAEAWLAPTGRYRLGGLAGAWHKPQAVYIGHVARAAARRQRLEQIRLRLAEIAGLRQGLALERARLAADRETAVLEWRQAPSEQRLRQALLDAVAAGAQAQLARQKLDRAEAACREAEQAAMNAQRQLEEDAADMGLPLEAQALLPVMNAVQDFNDALHRLLHAAQEWRYAQSGYLQQQAREAETLTLLQESEAVLARLQHEAEEAQQRFEVMNEAIGAEVSTLRQQLSESRRAVEAATEAEKSAAEAWFEAGKHLERAGAKAESAQAELQRWTEARAAAVSHLQQFAATPLLASALPTLELPDLRTPWTIDPALGLARRIEQALQQTADDDAQWAKAQKLITDELLELQRALSALGHQAPAEANDWGFVVHILFNNRAERPDQLAARLADDIAQRSELLSAHERAVLENHLQAEIAAQIQRLLRSAERQVDAINKELHLRPTSTGVRYRLQWQPLGETEGAPVGLEAARQRLLNTGADLWSAEDRRVVGAMLQQRIMAERERADSDAAGNASLIDQLARALDYRRWHAFRVQRYQDGQWRRLSGPASSGERALGLTVPLFAAIASFYSQGSTPLAPRLMLLDEAFAGIDKDARAHCMALIREFDLDFVITSESEWACYAELPGVAICQLQRREGVDAVFVSRWVWDGRERRREDDPDRRFSGNS